MGDLIQFTAPANDLKIASRELGRVEAIGPDGRLSLKMDGGRDVQLDPREHPHLDHGYAVTSHSSQGQPEQAITPEQPEIAPVIEHSMSLGHSL